MVQPTLGSTFPRQVGLDSLRKVGELEPGNESVSSIPWGFLPAGSCSEFLSWLNSVMDCNLEGKAKTTLSSPRCFWPRCLSWAQKVNKNKCHWFLYHTKWVSTFFLTLAIAFPCVLMRKILWVHATAGLPKSIAESIVHINKRIQNNSNNHNNKRTEKQIYMVVKWMNYGYIKLNGEIKKKRTNFNRQQKNMLFIL